MRIEHLQQIIEIEKQQSISKAAKVLYTAQPSLSTILSNFEQEIGIKIFERGPGGVIPTDDGAEILRLAKEMINCQDQMLNYGKRSKDLYGTMTVLITQSYGFLFSDMLMSFKAHFPKAKLDLQIRMPEEIVDEIARGSASIGVTLWNLLPDQTNQFLEKNNIAYETFGKHHMMLYVSQDNRWAENNTVALKELRGEQFVAYSPGYWDAINRQIQANREPLVMTDRENLKRLINDGRAVAIMPETFAMHDLYCEQGLIKLIPLDDGEDFGEGVDYLMYPAKRELTLLEKGVLELLRKELQDLIE